MVRKRTRKGAALVTSMDANMDINQLGSIGEFVGAVAVVISLFHIGSQIKQSSSLSKANTEFDISAELNRLHEAVFSSGDFAQILTKSERRLELDEVEKRRLRSYALRMMTTWIAIQQAHTHGAVSLEYFDRIQDDVPRTCNRYPVIKEMVAEMLRDYPKYRDLEIFERVADQASVGDEGQRSLC